MSSDYRALCKELADKLATCWPSTFDPPDCLSRARAALAEPVAEGPTDEEIMNLMPQQMHKDLAAAVRAMAEEEGIDSTPAKGVMRIMLNRHCVDLARAVLARYGHHFPDAKKMVSQPAQPVEKDVAELVTHLRRASDGASAMGWEQDSWVIARAAELLERQAAPVPVAVGERLPEPSVKVLAHYFNDLGKGRTICAIWVPAKTRSDSYGDDDFTECDEESDTFYWPEGWYEAIENWDDLDYVKVDEGEVIYWQPLPKWPAHPLPLPAGEVQP